MSVWKDFKEYFDGTRERKAKAAVLAAEKERRDAVRPIQEGAQIFIESGAYDAARDRILGAAANTLPSPELGLDSAGAFWYRRGLEQAVHMLDSLVTATADGEVQ